ncbi:MAG: Dna2/Cas4 domain-containing protein [Thermoplasmata archaeon]
MVVHEVKKSRKLEEVHIWQVKYYIWVLRRLGIKVNLGVIHYPKLRKKLEVIFNKEDEEKIKEAIDNIYGIKKQKLIPHVLNEPYCRNCAHFEFCFA